MNTRLSIKELDELKISLLAEAGTKLVNALKDFEIEDLTIRERGGHGIKTKYNDRRMCYWISCEYEGREYWLTLFESDIDPDSGNCHTQYGKIMFVKDLVRNRSSVSSPNKICDRDGDSVLLRFGSGKWKNAADFVTCHIPEGRAYITAGDVLENDGIVDETAAAFVRFVRG